MHFEIEFTGHKNIRSLHQRTIEITKEPHLTTNGDCIIGVNASYACKDLPDFIKTKLIDPNSTIEFSIQVNEHFFKFTGKGHKDLILSHPSDIVLRKSTFICPRTLAVSCNKASDSIPRKLIRLLQDPKTTGILSINIK